MPEKLVDFHCHLDLYPNFEELVRECDEKRIFTLAVTTTPRAWARNQELASATRHVRAALGLHPKLVAQHGADIVLFERLLPMARYVGEVGLDAGPAYFHSLPEQKEVFRRILEACSKSGPKVLSVHSVRAAGVVLEMVERHLRGTDSQVVLHWFSGSRAEAKRAVALGCWFSVNAQMMSNERLATTIAQEVPLNKVLTETDGPFTETGGRASTPVNAAESLNAIAKTYGRSRNDTAKQVIENLGKLTRRP